MPEGDTIHHTASALRTALVGHALVAFEAPYLFGLKPAIGGVIEEIESFGKHLEIAWDDGVVLHTHMKMSGSWHLYHPGERWRRPQREMVVMIATETWVAVCFNAPIVETYRSFDKRRHPGYGHLGPDLCKDAPDIDECVRRLDLYTEPDEPIAEALLDQRIACGVGNVYKSELLWRCAINPFLAVKFLEPDERKELLSTAADLLKANRNRTRRVTAPEAAGGLAVYGRNGRPCPRCGDAIKVQRTGQHLRATYWCPSCQAPLRYSMLSEITPSGTVRMRNVDPAGPPPAFGTPLDDSGGQIRPSTRSTRNSMATRSFRSPGTR
jgi:endonuclease-8